MYSTRTLPTHDCQFVILWTYGGKPWAENLKQIDGVIYYFDDKTNDFVAPVGKGHVIHNAHRLGTYIFIIHEDDYIK